MAGTPGLKHLPEISKRLNRAYPDARYELNFDNPLQLLVATILAAQCTDVRVNQVTPALFKKYRNAHALAKATPEETDAYKRFVMTVAQAVASAHKEGGFLGIGGKQISDAENQALDEISAALGAPPST